MCCSVACKFVIFLLLRVPPHSLPAFIIGWEESLMVFYAHSISSLCRSHHHHDYYHRYIYYILYVYVLNKFFERDRYSSIYSSWPQKCTLDNLEVLVNFLRLFVKPFLITTAFCRNYSRGIYIHIYLHKYIAYILYIYNVDRHGRSSGAGQASSRTSTSSS